MNDRFPQQCIYPGCDRPVVPHPLGGPPSAFCDLDNHHALSAHQERQRLAATREPDVGRQPAAKEEIKS